jgi:hypothetical protein
MFHRDSVRSREQEKSRDSSVGIAAGYGLDNPQFESKWGQEFSLLHVVQTGSGAHPASHPMSTSYLSPGVKRSRREADHSPPGSAKVKKMWFYTSTPSYVFMA